MSAQSPRSSESAAPDEDLRLPPQDNPTTPQPEGDALSSAESPFAALKIDEPTPTAPDEAPVKPAEGDAPKDTPAEPVAPAAPLPPNPTTTAKLPPAPTPPAARKSSPLGPILGGVIAAGIGFGAAHFVPEGWPIGPSRGENDALRVEVAALSQKLAAQSDTAPLGALEAEVAALQAALAALPPPAPDQGAEVAALRAEIATLRDELANRPTFGAEDDANPSAAALLQTQIEELRNQLSAIPSTTADELQTLKAAIEAERAASQARAEAAQAEAAKLAREGVIRAALLRVQAALESGAALAPALADLTQAGLEPPADLRAKAEGVASLTRLQTRFPEAAREALARSSNPAEGATITDRLGSFLIAQTGMRSLDPREGTDPDAILSRAEAKLAAGDLSGTLAEITTMPQPAQEAPLLEGWRLEAQARLEALASVAALSETFTAASEGK